MDVVVLGLSLLQFQMLCGLRLDHARSLSSPSPSLSLSLSLSLSPSLSLALSLAVSRSLSLALREQFRERMDQVHAHGDTRLNDAILDAAEQLKAYTQGKEGCQARIIALTDGADTDSLASKLQVVQALQAAGIVLDAITISPHVNHDLKAMAKATGGLSFHPSVRGDADKGSHTFKVLCSTQFLSFRRSALDTKWDQVLCGPYQKQSAQLARMTPTAHVV